MPTEGGISDGSPAGGGGKRCIFADLRISSGEVRAPQKLKGLAGGGPRTAEIEVSRGGEVRAPQKLKVLGGGASSQI